MLLTDTNILRRVCLGRVMQHVERLRQRQVRLATTSHNAFELRKKLLQAGLTRDTADQRVTWALAPFMVMLADEYESLRQAAEARLRQGGTSDWPLLAAALVTDGDIWSEDKDFFGTGVPVWSTANLRFVEQD